MRGENHAYRRTLLDRLHALHVGEAYSDKYRRIKLGDPIVAQIPADNRLIGPTLGGIPLDIRYRHSTTTRSRDFATDVDMLAVAAWLPRALAELDSIAAQDPALEIWPPAGSLMPELIIAYDADVFDFDEWADLHLRPQKMPAQPRSSAGAAQFVNAALRPLRKSSIHDPEDIPDAYHNHHPHQPPRYARDPHHRA